MKKEILKLKKLDSAILYKLKNEKPDKILPELILILNELVENSENEFLNSETKYLEKGIASIVRAQFKTKQKGLEKYAPDIINTMYDCMEDRGPCLFKSFMDTLYVIFEYYSNNNLETSNLFRWVKKTDDNPWIKFFLVEKYFENTELTNKIISKIKEVYPKFNIDSVYRLIEKETKTKLAPSTKHKNNKKIPNFV